MKRDKNGEDNGDTDSNKEKNEAPRNNEDDADSDAVEKEGNDTSEKKSDEKLFGSFGSNTRNNSEGGNGGNGVPPDFTGASLLATLMLIGFTYFMIRNDDDNVAPTDFSREITWNDFCNYLLETGQVEKVVVTNNRTMAKVFRIIK